MLEHADSLSVLAVRPESQTDVTFRWFNSDGSAQDGTLTILYSPSAGERAEWHFGEFHLINIATNGKLIISGRNSSSIPAAVRMVGNIVPIHLVRFDHADTIRAISESVVRGRAALCIQFDTTYGSNTTANEICIDKSLGTMVRFQEGADVTENSEWFQFDGAYFPARIDLFRHGVEEVEIHESQQKIEGQLDANVFLPPPGAEIKTRCHDVKRPFIQSTPQPPAGNAGSGITDVFLHGTINKDGIVRSIVVDQSDRTDLNAEAIQTVSHWSFSSALCDGKPMNWEANFVVHFQGR